MGEGYLVVGTNRFAILVVEHLLKLQRPVITVVRDRTTAPITYLSSTYVIVGDPLDPTTLREACRDARILYDCLENPARKRTQRTHDTIETLLLACIENGVKLVIPSHLYNSELENQDIESDVLAASEQKLTNTLVARYPQMYGPELTAGLLFEVCRRVASGKKPQWTDKLDVRRSFVFAGDAAASLALLGDTDPAYGRTWNVAGPRALTGREFLDQASKPPIESVGIESADDDTRDQAPDGEAKALSAMPYNYKMQFELDQTRFREAFPRFQYVPHEIAIPYTVGWFQRSIAA